MEAKTLSAGAVIVRKTPKAWLYLLLRAYTHWDFPKGLVEKGEDPLSAARREVKEETGIEDLIFSWGEPFAETEPYRQGKVARYYVAETSQENLTLPLSPELGRPEHHEYRWFTYGEARAILVPRIQKILDWAQGILDKGIKV
jgi:bis(5'-nucleosidyl)-tetraphosphatase